MHKLIVDGKEIEWNGDGPKPVSEEELEIANGGAAQTSYHSRWVCVQCGAHGPWIYERGQREFEQNFHYQQTGHYTFKTEGRYFDGPVDPYAD